MLLLVARSHEPSHRRHRERRERHRIQKRRESIALPLFSTPSVTDAPTQSLPLFLITNEKFSQPIFGANYLSVTVLDWTPGAPVSANVRITFNKGGCSTFLRFFLELMGLVHASRERDAAVAAAQEAAHARGVLLGATLRQQISQAYVDPSDPSVVYVSQPTFAAAPPPPAAPPAPAPFSAPFVPSGGGYASASPSASAAPYVAAPAPIAPAATTGYAVATDPYNPYPAMPRP